jgi:WS/DGAT/MGAT family acyltransferase
MAARIMAQRLDRSRPLWECWVLEGVKGGRFALVMKTHHCMVEEEGSDLMEVLLSADPEAPDPDPPPRIPRPLPSARELVMNEVVHQARLPRRTFNRVRRYAQSPDELRHDLESRARRAAGLLGYGFRPPMDTPLNGPTGRHRRFRGVSFPLDDAKRVRQRLGGTVHDVILAVVAGATRSYLLERLVNPAAIDFRICTPVGIVPGHSDQQVAEWILDLPVWEKDPIERFEQIRADTAKLSEDEKVVSASVLVAGETWFGGRLLSASARAQASRAPVNMMLTNSPGAQVPLYLRGARMLEVYGEVPLREHHGLSIAVMSYDGRLSFGLNADYDAVRDLDRYVLALEQSFASLVEAAGAAQPVMEEDEAEGGEEEGGGVEKGLGVEEGLGVEKGEA